MNKSELIAVVAKETNASKSEAGRIINTMLLVVTKILESGENVTLSGFGTFKSRERMARTLKNPKTGKQMGIPERIVPTFKSSKLIVTPRK